MNETYRDHPSEDALERFIFNQSDDEEVEVVESHFLACDLCVTRLETLELDIAARKIAMRSILAEEAAKLAQPAAKRRSLFGWLTIPQISFAGAATAACAIALTAVSIPREVNLIAERGNETSVVSKWRPLHLRLQEHDLNAGPVTVQIVDPLGKQVWKGGAMVKNEEIEVNAPRPWATGDFLVRLYSPSPTNDMAELVREYKLQVGSGF